jgi:hypothetical protein
VLAQAVNSLMIDREVEWAKFRSGHRLGQQNRATLQSAFWHWAVHNDGAEPIANWVIQLSGRGVTASERHLLISRATLSW